MRLIFLLKIAGLTLWRSWRATLVLSFMVVSAVAALVFLSSLAVGTNDAMIRNSTGLFTGHIAGSMIGEDDLDRVQGHGIEQVLIRRQQQLLLESDGVLEPVLLTGVDPLLEKKTTAFWRKTVAGRYLLPGEDAIYLSQETAGRLNLTVGGKVAVVSRNARPLKHLVVCGIYRTGISQFDQGLAFCPHQALPAGEATTAIAVFLQAGAPVDGTTARLRQLIPTATFASWPEFMPDLKQLIDLDSVCMAIVIVLVFAIVSIGIACTFLIFSLKNLREFGIMKAMGMLAEDTALLLVAQIGLMTILAAAIGTAAGIALVALFSHIGIDISAFTSHNQYFTVSGILYPRLTGPAVITPPLAAIVFGLAAAIWPVVYVVRRNPAEILRNV